MSYPEPRYHGEKGEHSAVYLPAERSPEFVIPSDGTRIHYLATGASTNGNFGLYRWEMGPAPSGPGPHFHRSISESFYILEGSVRIYGGERWIDTEPGDFIHVPEGGVHAFRNESGAPASMLLHFSPGAPREAYFEGIPKVPGMTEEEVLEFLIRHDTYRLD